MLLAPIVAVAGPGLRVVKLWLVPKANPASFVATKRKRYGVSGCKFPRGCCIDCGSPVPIFSVGGTLPKWVVVPHSNQRRLASPPGGTTPLNNAEQHRILLAARVTATGGPLATAKVCSEAQDEPAKLWLT